MTNTITQQELTEIEAKQRGKQAKKFEDVSPYTEYFYLYQGYRSNLCTARCVRVHPQCSIREKIEFNAECWGGTFPDLKNYNLNAFVLVDRP